MFGVGKPRAPSWASRVGAAGGGLSLDWEHLGHAHADHWLLQSEPGLSDGEGSSGSTQSLKDLIYFTAKRKQHKSSECGAVWLPWRESAIGVGQEDTRV